MRFSARTVLGGLINEYERAAQRPRSGGVAEFWNPTDYFASCSRPSG
jgi:hypothetical protein